MTDLMIKYPLNAEKSKEIYTSCKRYIEMKECYHNVFHVVTNYQDMFVSGMWRVAYGYMTVFDNLLCRHCFIIDNEGKVIDPTIYATGQDKLREYYVMHIFNDIDDYFDVIEAENYYPALIMYFRKETENAQKWARENDMILLE